MIHCQWQWNVLKRVSSHQERFILYLTVFPSCFSFFFIPPREGKRGEFNPLLTFLFSDVCCVFDLISVTETKKPQNTSLLISLHSSINILTTSPVQITLFDFISRFLHFCVYWCCNFRVFFGDLDQCLHIFSVLDHCTRIWHYSMKNVCKKPAGLQTYKWNEVRKSLWVHMMVQFLQVFVGVSKNLKLKHVE